jgi:hypothetical protein
VRRNGRRGERRAEVLLEICRVPQDLGCELRGDDDNAVRVIISQVRGLMVKVRKEARTFSAVPSSRRSKEHDAAMIAALLRDVV